LETVSLVLVILVAVVASGAVARVSLLPLPLPLVQIVLGAAISAVARDRIDLKPDIFFLLFLPPLLFLDGWRIPKEGLYRDRGTILELALGLVVFTVVGVGFFIHWMIPAMPLAVAFALAAILSPTDPIAVSAIASRIPIPKRLMHILEGEALLNDASGLVCMRFAVAAALTGTFSLVDAIGTFLWVATGGLAIGIAVTWGATIGKNWLSRRYGEDPGSQILISLLIPFGAYLLAEHLQCSGILAAVAAGITMTYAEQTGKALAVTRVRRGAVWDMIQFTANGVIFVLLGEQLPHLFRGAAQVVWESGHSEPIWLAFYVVAISAALAALRFVWVWASLRVTSLLAARRGEPMGLPGWRLIIVVSLAGIRGAITLAGVLTLPLVMNDGTLFPARDLAIFLAAGVIIMSLVAASVGLPPLLKGLKMPAEGEKEEHEDQARVAAAQAAIQAIEKAQHDMGEGRVDADLYADAASRIMALYRRRMDGHSKTGQERAEAYKRDEIERALWLTGLQAERDTIYRAARRRKLPDDIASKLVREIDLLEARIGSK